MELGNRHALDLWRDITNSAIKGDGPDLTARQTALLLTVHLDEERHTVRGLSKRLGLQKPAIVRAIDALQSLGLLNRVRDQNDRRNVFIEPTEKGAQRLMDIASIISHGLNSIPVQNRFAIENNLHTYAAE